jgi:hypothetical protein
MPEYNLFLVEHSLFNKRRRFIKYQGSIQEIHQQA